MPPDRRSLREIRRSYEAFRRYQLHTGQWAQWFRYNPAVVTSDEIYEVGPQRVWYPSIAIPVLDGIYQRAPLNMDGEGLYLVDHIRLVLSYDAFFHSTIPDPDPSGQDHQNDRFGFDGTLFRILSFLPRGRLADYFLTISVSAVEVVQEELIEDNATSMFAPYMPPF